MAVYSRHHLSGSVNGAPILVTGTASDIANIIHTVQATSTTSREMLWLQSELTATGANAFVFLQFENATATMLYQKQIIGDFSEHFEGLPLTATTSVVRAWYASATVPDIMFFGFVNRSRAV